MKKPKKRSYKLSRDVATDRLLRAVGRWVNAYGGRAMVAGGIGLMSYPADPEHTFHVVIRVTGRKPEKVYP